MESELKDKEILSRISELKNLTLDTFKVGNYVDIQDESKNWCVGEITDRLGDIITVHYEGCPVKLDEKVSIKRSNKVTHYRKFTRGYSGLKKSAARNYTFNPEDVKELEGIIKKFSEEKFTNISDPIELTQIIRGRIFTYIDILMTTNYTVKEQITAIPLVINLILEFINMSVVFFNFYKENLFIINEYLIKNKDLYLVHGKSAVLSCLYDVILSLKRILGEDQRVSEFYKNYEDAIRKHFKNLNLITKTKICIEKAYKNNSEYNKLPASIIATLLDHFYEKKGFELIWSIFLSPAEFKLVAGIPFEVLDHFMNFLQLFKVIIEYKNVFPNELSGLRAYFYSRINNLSENEIKELKKTNFINAIKNFTIMLPIESKIQKNVFEDLYINYYYKCLTSKNLEKRIAGITSINLIIDTIERKENFSGFSSNSSSNINNNNNNGNKIETDDLIENLDSKALLTFFKDKNFIDVLLGENIHEEIIKRALPFFKLLAKKNSIIYNLNNSVYDLLWSNYLEKHESISIQIQMIICELACFIPDKDKQYLFSKIKSYFGTGFDSNNQCVKNINAIPNTKTINFLKNFTESCLKRSVMNYKDAKLVDLFTDEKMFGLPLLWAYMQDSSNNSSLMVTEFPIQSTEIIELCLNSIFELITISAVDDYVREKIISMCLENISKNYSVVQSMNLMKKIICEFTNLKSKRTVSKMDETFNTINLILSDFTRYNLKVKNTLSCSSNEVKQAYSENENSSKEQNMNIIFEGFYSHKTNIDGRLDTIYFFTNANSERGRLPFNFEHIDSLWSLLVTNANDISETNAFIEGLRKNCEEFDDSLIEYIFLNLISNKQKNNFENLNLISCNLFEKLLNLTNYNMGKFYWDGRNYRIDAAHEEEIIGFDTIFEIITTVENDNVRRKLSNLLVELCTEIKSFTENLCVKYWTRFLEKIFLTLNESYKKNNEKGVKGIITFIKTLIRNIGSPGEIPNSEEVNFVREGVEFNFVFSDKNESRAIKIGINETTFEVRTKAAYYFDVPINMLNFRRQGKVIDMSEDYKIFRTEIFNNFNVEVFESQHPILKIKNNPKDMIINDMSLVKILHSLLHNSEAGYITDVWELINVLPKNGEIEQEIKDLGDREYYINNESIDWKKYFDDNSIYIMSYSLKIVKHLIFCKNEKFEKNENKNENFVYIENNNNDNNDKMEMVKEQQPETLFIPLSEIKEISNSLNPFINNIDNVVLSQSSFHTENTLNEKWILTFTKNKGVDYLLQLLFQFKLEHFDSDLGFECLNDLIYLLKNMNTLQSINQSNIILRLIQIIKLIILSSVKKDQDTKLTSIQDRHRRRRDKDLIKFNEDNEEASSTFNSEENIYCEELIKIWINEDNCIRNIVTFLHVFHINDETSIFNVLLSDNELMNSLLTWALITPLNFKLKNSIHEFINNLLKTKYENEELIEKFKLRIFENMLTEETLELASKHNESSGAFFKVLASLIEKYLNFNLNNLDVSIKNKIDYLSLSEYMINYIKNLNSGSINQLSDSNTNTDNVLEGYLILLRLLILKSREITDIITKKHNLIAIILDKCLFSKCQPSSSNAPFPECKTSSSRLSAFRLLSAVSYNNPDTTKKIISTLQDSHALGYWKSKKLLDWRISLQYDEKSSSGFIGLKNLGCTCYMNSLIQQFFMITELRESILASDDKFIFNNNYKNIEGSSLYQLKNIFSSLKAYDSQAYNAKDFTMNFDGQVLDIREQMDVDEFFNTLIDKVENHLKDSPYQNLFKHFFGFSISDEFICKGCPHYSERNVYSQSIQLQVLNKKSITESLKSYVEGELLEGDNAYHCDKCEKKVTALKRQCIKRLPRMLMVVMKRFEFDYENMVKIKVNDYCEFPHELNMEPYTQEYLQAKSSNSNNSNNNNNNNNNNLNDEERDSENSGITENKDKDERKNNKMNKPNNYYKYNLSGVIIHTGTSESGHYYSIIKNDENKWYEFNDNNVKEYDISDLANEAYGGTETVINRENKKESVEKQTNAYLLFYKREYEYDEDNYNLCDTQFNSTVVKSRSDKFSNISATIMDRINLDNLQYWIMKSIFSPEYHSFITDLLVNSNTYDHIVKNYLTKNDNTDMMTEININYRNNYSPSLKLNCNVDSNMIVDSSTLLNNSNEDYVMIHNKEDDLVLFKFTCSFFFNVLIRAKDKTYMPAMIDIIKSFINKEVTHAEWLLEEFSNYELVNDYLLECPIIEVRKIIVGVLYASMIKIYKSENTDKDKDKIDSQFNPTLKKFINNLISIFIKNKDNGDKDLTYLYYLIYRFSLLGEESRFFLYQIGILHYLTLSYVSKTGVNVNSNVNPLNSNVNTNTDSPNSRSIFNINYIQPSHSELNQKLMNKVDRMSAFEELLEKKHSEKLLIGKSEYYLLMTFCELIKTCNINPNNSNNTNTNPNSNSKLNIKSDPILLKLLTFTNPDLIKILILEVKSKSSAVCLSNLFLNICFNNIEISNTVQGVLLELINIMDYYESEFIMSIFKRFLLKIDDSLKDNRVKTLLVKYFQILYDNFKFWGFIDYNVDFIIKLFYSHYDTLKIHIDSIKDIVLKIIKFIKDNSYPPNMIQSKTTVMYKKKQVMFSNKVTQTQINNFIQKFTIITNEKIMKLKDIYNKQCVKTDGFDSDYDLTDFKFCVKDRVKYEGYNAIVIGVLDEMINIEYDKEDILNTKRPATQWVETDAKNLVIVRIHDDSESMLMDVEK